VVSRSGVHRATCSKSKGNPISSRPERKWDAPVLAVDVSYLSLAHAAGDEGLFELGISEPGDYGFDGETYNKPKRIGKRNCTDCNWTFYSIYGSSHVDDGFLASYRKVQQKHEPFFFQRIFENLISAENRRTSFTMVGDTRGGTKISYARYPAVRYASSRVISYRPWEDEKPKRLTDLGAIDLAESGDVRTIELSPWKGQVVSGAAALFGTIIEC
jgi:hypothetical protein